MKKISIIIPVYNEKDTLREIVSRVEQVDFCGLEKEIILVDDASTDETVNIIESYSQSEPRVQFAIKKQNSGIADTRNQCIQMARGHYLAFLDADDIWHPEKIDCQLS